MCPTALRAVRQDCLQGPIWRLGHGLDVQAKLFAFAELLDRSHRGSDLPAVIFFEVDATVPADLLALALLRTLSDCRSKDHANLLVAATRPPSDAMDRSLPVGALTARGRGRSALSRMRRILECRPTRRTALAILWRATQDPSTSTGRPTEFIELCRQAARSSALQAHPGLCTLLLRAPQLLGGRRWREWRREYADALREAIDSDRNFIRCAVALVWIAGRPASIHVGPGRSGDRLVDLAGKVRAPRVEHYARATSRILSSRFHSDAMRRAIGGSLRCFAATRQPARFAVVAIQTLAQRMEEGRYPLQAIGPSLAAGITLSPDSPAWSLSLGRLLDAFRNPPRQGAFPPSITAGSSTGAAIWFRAKELLRHNRFAAAHKLVRRLASTLSDGELAPLRAFGFRAR